MDIAVYRVGIPTTSDPNTHSYVGTLIIDGTTYPDFVVADGNEVRIPIGSTYSFAIIGVNEKGDRGLTSDAVQGVAKDENPPVDRTPVKPSTPTLSFLRVETESPVPPAI